MLGSVVGYFFSVITVFAGVMTFMALLIGVFSVFDNSTFEKLRYYPRPIIERSAPAPPILEPHRLGTNDARAPQHLSAPDKNTKDSRAASSPKADAENREPERKIRPERLALGGFVGGLADALDSVLTALTPQLRPHADADNQAAAPASQQKPQPSSTPLPQSILAAKPLGPASQFQPPSATPAQQQTTPQVSATPAPHAAIANDDDRPASRRVRHPRKQATFTSNAPRYRDENYVPRYGPDQYGAWSGGATQRFDARGYDRVYNSYGEPRFGPDAHYLRRLRVIPRSPETLYPTCRPGRRDASSTGAAAFSAVTATAINVDRLRWRA